MLRYGRTAMTVPSDVPVAANPDEKAGNSPTDQGQKPNSPESEDSRKTQASEKDLDTLPDWARSEIKELRGEARERRLNAREADRIAKETREKDLADQQQWQKLAQERADELGKVKPKADQYDELAELFDKQYAAEVKDWPVELLEMAPAADAPITS